MEVLLVAVAVVAALAIAIWLIALAFGALGFTFTGAAVLGVAAAEQGFIGLAVYAAAWVFMFPLMLVVSLVLGFVMSERGDDEQARRLDEDQKPDVLEMLAEQERARKPQLRSKLED